MDKEHWPPYTIEEVSFGNDSHTELSVLVNGRRFHIDVKVAALRDPGRPDISTRFELELLALLQDIDNEIAENDKTSAMNDGQSSGEDDPDDSVEDGHGCDHEHHLHSEGPLEAWVLGPFLRRQVFDQFAAVSTTPTLETLYDHIHTPTLFFTLKYLDGELVPTQMPADPVLVAWYARSAPLDMSEYWSQCVQVTPLEITVSENESSQNPHIVTFDGEKCFFKPVVSNVGSEVYGREIDTNIRIERAGLLSQLRIPRLNALVMNTDSQEEPRIHGILFDLVPGEAMISERLEDASVSLRRRWYDDVAHMIDSLHRSRIVWGDFKPDNMLLDTEDNVWMIDFGGGTTTGWVEVENTETVKGDLQGLRRFKRYLGLK